MVLTTVGYGAKSPATPVGQVSSTSKFSDCKVSSSLRKKKNISEYFRHWIFL
jgi:hypothetical protein